MQESHNRCYPAAGIRGLKPGSRLPAPRGKEAGEGKMGGGADMTGRGGALYVPAEPPAESRFRRCASSGCGVRSYRSKKKQYIGQVVTHPCFEGLEAEV